MKQKLVTIASIIFLTFNFIPNAICQWVPGNGPFADQVTCFASSSTNLFAGTWKGVFLSTDNGTSWNKVGNNGLTNLHVLSLAVSGQNLFAGTLNDGGVFLSTNNGTNWTLVNTGLPNYDILTLAVSGTNLFAGTNGRGIFRSTDNGTSWTPADSSFPVGIKLEASRISALAVKGTNLFAGAGGFVFLSANNGTSWTQSNIVPGGGEVDALAISGTNLFAGLGGSVYLSTNNGANWTSSNIVPSGDAVYALAISGTNLFAGTYNNFGVYLSTDNGTSWAHVNNGQAIAPVNTLMVSGTNLIAGLAGQGIWRRPLSDFGSSSVTHFTPSSNSVTSFPNPFSQSTSIKFSSSNPTFTQVSIHNLLGSEVARLFSGELDGGEHSFTWDARGMPPGMYICIIRASGRTEELPVMLMK